MWRFQGNACVVARAKRSRNARMVDAVWQRLQCLVVSTLHTNDVVDARLMQCTSRCSCAAYCSVAGRVLPAIRRACSRHLAPRGGQSRGPDGILACKLTNPIRILSAGGASPSHDGRLPVPFFDAKNIGGDALSWHTTVLRCRRDSCRTAMCTTQKKGYEGLRQPPEMNNDH